MNILVIATHHGAFVTLQQLKQWNYENVLVVIPQSQIDKYSKLKGEIFTEYERNIERFCRGKFKVYVAEWDQSKKLQSAKATLEALGATASWLVLESGTLLGGAHSRGLPPCNTTYGLTYRRVHPKMKRLYTMLGEDEESKVVCLNSFIVNLDDSSGRVSILDSNLFHRPDVLYAKSFGMLWCLRYQQMVQDALTLNFWMEAIRSEQEDGEWVAYPYDWYKGYASKVKKYLPASSYTNIVENGEMTAELESLVAMDL